MPDKQRTFGQYETPADVADLLLGFCLRSADDLVLDPSCGEGAFLLRAGQFLDWMNENEPPIGKLWGIELDPLAAAQAQTVLPWAHIVNRNFFMMEPWPDKQFDALIGNPPYTRAEWFNRLLVPQQPSRQLSIFNDDEASKAEDVKGPSPIQYDMLDRRAGLHAHFFVHGTEFLREGGRFGFVVPNSWLDVAYGARLKQFLLDHYKILALIESSVERWFNLVKINTCLVVLEKCEDAQERMNNKTRLVRLRRPLTDFIPSDPTSIDRMAEITSLSTRIINGEDGDKDSLSIRVEEQGHLPANDKWGIRLRAPAVLQKRRWKANLHPLKSWATIHRGFTTGANAFFYLDKETIEEWQIESRFRQPLLKSFRHVASRQITVENCDIEVLLISPSQSLTNTAVVDYINWGEEQGFHLGSTCANRQPWYILPEQESAPILLAKGIWARHFAPLVQGGILVDQQLYQIHLAEGVSEVAAAALLNSAWFSLQLELYGRVNLGEGVLWLATYEIEGILLPDPRYLPDQKVSELVDAYQNLLEIPVATIQREMAHPIWQRFNELVYEIIGLSPVDSRSISEALLERVNTRRIKAGKV